MIDFIVSSAVENSNNDNNNSNDNNSDSKDNVNDKKSDKKVNKNNDNNNNTNDKSNDKKQSNQQNNSKNKKKKVVVADMMAGVGPFGVPLAMNNITVFANDLNPESYKYLDKNMRINNCEKYLHTYNMCGR